MIKSLYFRMVLTFIAVVTISVVLSFFTSSRSYKNDFADKIQDDMTNMGRNVIHMYQELRPEDPEDFLNSIAKLRGFTMMKLYIRTDGAQEYSVVEQENKFQTRHDDIVYVLEGKLFRLPVADTGADPTGYQVGLPFEIDGQQHALFLMSDFPKQNRQFRKGLGAVLIPVLIIGSLLILVASRYFVNPLTAITEATKRIAKGDFNVRLAVRRKDEIGVLADSFNHMANELKILEEMRQDFVSNVSHEIQTPLTSIRGFSKALQNGLVDEADRIRYLRIIERESDRLSRLSENLLNLASLESERHPFHPKTIDLDEQLRKVVLTHEPLWTVKELDIQLDLPNTKIVADEDELNQVWTNLFNNSIKYTPVRGKIFIRIEQGVNSTVKVIVSDTGIGIAPESKKRIFERFYKEDPSRQFQESSGSGLGLAIAKKIIEIHGGEIDLESEQGKGTTFTVTLPIRR